MKTYLRKWLGEKDLKCDSCGENILHGENHWTIIFNGNIENTSELAMKSICYSCGKSMIDNMTGEIISQSKNIT